VKFVYNTNVGARLFAIVHITIFLLEDPTATNSNFSKGSNSPAKMQRALTTRICILVTLERKAILQTCILCSDEFITVSFGYQLELNIRFIPRKPICH
jgi:hypothetical protein